MVDIVDGIDGAEELQGVVFAASFQNCAEGVRMVRKAQTLAAFLSRS